MDANPFTAVDRTLLRRCLNKEPGSWNDFVDRFLSLIYHVIGYTAHLRSVRLAPEDLEDIAAEVLLKIVANNFKVLREFRGNASLATYLSVVARRICVQELVRRQGVKDAIKRGESRLPEVEPDDAPAAVKGMELFTYDAQHAFCNADRPEVYNASAASQAWARTVAFVRQHTT